MDKEIEELRQELDIIDDNIAGLLEERIKAGKKIVALKRKNGISKDDPGREKVILKRLVEQHPELSGLIENIYPRIFDWVKNH